MAFTVVARTMERIAGYHPRRLFPYQRSTYARTSLVFIRGDGCPLPDMRAPDRHLSGSLRDLDGDDELASGIALLEVPHGRRNLTERERPVHGWCDLP